MANNSNKLHGRLIKITKIRGSPTSSKDTLDYLVDDFDNFSISSGEPTQHARVLVDHDQVVRVNFQVIK